MSATTSNFSQLNGINSNNNKDLKDFVDFIGAYLPGYAFYAEEEVINVRDFSLHFPKERVQNGPFSQTIITVKAASLGQDPKVNGYLLNCGSSHKELYRKYSHCVNYLFNNFNGFLRSDYWFGPYLETFKESKSYQEHLKAHLAGDAKEKMLQHIFNENFSNFTRLQTFLKILSSDIKNFDFIADNFFKDPNEFVCNLSFCFVYSALSNEQEKMKAMLLELGIHQDQIVEEGRVMNVKLKDLMSLLPIDKKLKAEGTISPGDIKSHVEISKTLNSSENSLSTVSNANVNPTQSSSSTVSDANTNSTQSSLSTVSNANVNSAQNFPKVSTTTGFDNFVATQNANATQVARPATQVRTSVTACPPGGLSLPTTTF